MKKTEIISKFLSLRRGTGKHGKSIAKPLLLIAAFERCHLYNERLGTLQEYKVITSKCSEPFKSTELLYPFARLYDDGVWDIERIDDIKRNPSNDFIKSEIRQKNIKAGLTHEIYQAISNDPLLLAGSIKSILDKYFNSTHRSLLRNALEVVATYYTSSTTVQPYLQNTVSISEDSASYVQDNEQIEGKPDLLPSNHNRGSMMDGANEATEPHGFHENGFVAYLNSLHNISASGSNALAESQALSQYFNETYEPFPIVENISSILNENESRVIVLTGHAGDGKSTVALDIYKQLEGVSPQTALTQPLEERIDVLPSNDRPSVSIIKDMSELSSTDRLDWMENAYYKDGSWLIISNTGPLLNSFRDFSKKHGANEDHLESDILRKLQLTYDSRDLEKHTLDYLPKKTTLINMTRLDNVYLGARIFLNIINHSGWEQCTSCDIKSSCPIYANNRALKENSDQTEERIRWLYRKITEYEERLTLRQMIAHMAYSLTGGLYCNDAHRAISQHKHDPTNQLEKILFSELIFGYTAGKPSLPSTNLRAVELLNRYNHGIYISPYYDRQTTSSRDNLWVDLPETLDPIYAEWSQRAKDYASTPWRASLRRMIYFFGSPKEDIKSIHDIFLDSFLGSPNLRDYEEWKSNGSLSISRRQKEDLRIICLRVLLEIYSGFSSGQFSQAHDRLYLTLRRQDTASFQPTQAIINSFYFDDFKIEYSNYYHQPVLSYRGRVILPLSLPLMDFITQRHRGNLGGELDHMHQTQLEWFRSSLLEADSQELDPNEIRILRSEIDGKVHERRYLLDDAGTFMEILQ